MRLIDADVLLEKLKGYLLKNEYTESDEVRNAFVMNCIEEVELATTVDEWIPCSERLPEENGHYLVTYHCKSYGNYLPLFDDIYVRKMRFQNGKWMFPRNIDKEAQADEYQEVIAWQPLPQPYKEK